MPQPMWNITSRPQSISACACWGLPNNPILIQKKINRNLINFTLLFPAVLKDGNSEHGKNDFLEKVLILTLSLTLAPRNALSLGPNFFHFYAVILGKTGLPIPLGFP